MYIFNRVTVVPQLPDRIARLNEIANNMWWSWNTEFLRLFQMIDIDLWEQIGKNPIKFLKLVDQKRIEDISNDVRFLEEYQKVVENFDNYMNSKSTWFTKNYPNNSDDLVAYFSAEYGLDETVPIYSGGLGILSGDHLKSASDLGLPFVAVGLLYKNGYFHQKINSSGEQVNEYHNIDLYNLPIHPVTDEMGNELNVHNNKGKTRTSKKYPSVMLKVTENDTDHVTLKVDLKNEDDIDVSNYRYVITNSSGKVGSKSNVHNQDIC